MNSYITAIATANPPYKIDQKQVLGFMLNAHQLEGEAAEKLKVLYRATGITSRYSVVEDYLTSTVREFYPPAADLEPFPTTASRMLVYQREAIKICLEASRKALRGTSADEITHLITVSCTGMYAPGIDIELIDQLGLSSSIERTGINFMGCYAAFNAIKVADHICRANDDAKVLIVCVELCSIHFQKSTLEDYLLSNALFGDGAAAVIMSSKPGKGLNLRAVSFFNELQRKGHDHMAWQIGDQGFEMRLSAYVPEIIETGIVDLIKSLKEKSNTNQFDYFAVHPGGKKILRVIEKELGISQQENAAAHQVLADYGNMSSPTILFVLKRIMDNLSKEDQGKNLLGLAFGPGLTLESMLLRIEQH